MKVLFLCTGNTCRSPMAKAVFEKLLRERGLEKRISCDSAGLAASPGEPASREALKAAGEKGLDLSGHQAKQVTSEMLLDSDVIAVMTEGQKSLLERILPQLIPKVRVGGIPDPYGGTLEEYRACLEALTQWESSLLEELAGEEQ